MFSGMFIRLPLFFSCIRDDVESFLVLFLTYMDWHLFIDNNDFIS